MMTSRQAPVSNQPLQSPQSRMAVPEVWSNVLFSTMVFFGVLNKAPRALLLRTVLLLKTTSGVHSRFSIPQPVRALMARIYGMFELDQVFPGTGYFLFVIRMNRFDFVAVPD